MLKFFLPLAGLLLTFGVQAQLLNGSFEQWQNLATFEVPVENEVTFTSSNDITYYSDGVLSMFEVPGNGGGSAMRVETTSSPNGTEVGFGIWGFPPEDDIDLIFTGGFPFTDQAVTGLNCDLRYNVNSGSPGFIIVQFKFEGVPVGPGNLFPGTYIFPISGSQGNFENSTFNFLPALPSDVDECIIGVASNAILDDDPMLFPGDFIEIDNITFVGSDESVPGGDFEVWWDAPSALQPTGWDGAIFPGLELVQQSTDASDGDFAVQLTTLLIDGFVSTSILTQGELSDDGLMPSVFVPGDFSGLSFDYKYNAVGNDSAYVVIVMSELPNPDPSELSVWAETLEAQENYTSYVVDLSWISDFLDVNYVGIAFISSAEGSNDGIIYTPEVGSTLFVDNVTLTTAGGDICDFPVDINLGNEIVLCEGETALASVPEGFESYQWFMADFASGQAMPIEGATTNELDIDGDLVLYEVSCVVTLGECTVESNALLIDQWVFAPTVVQSTNTDLCEGESTSIEALGAEGTVFWFLNGVELQGVNDNPLTVSEPGEYVAAIAPDLCPNLLISSGLGPIINVSSNPNPVLEDTGAGVAVTLPFSTYTWFFNGELVEGETSQSIPYQGLTGEYTVEVTNSAGCTGTASITVTRVDTLNSESIVIYPNPVVRTMRVKTSGDFVIVGSDGREVISGKLVYSENAIDLSHLSAGVYIIIIGNSAHRFVKE